MMKAAKQPRSCAAAPDKVLASDREDEATVVDIMTQPREIETCGQLPQEGKRVWAVSCQSQWST